MISLGGAVVLGWSAVVVATSLWVIRPVRRRRGVADDRTPAPRVLLVRPCSGDEPGLEEALESSVIAAEAGTVRVRLAVATEDDTARPTAELACAHARAAGLDAEVVVTFAKGPNRKADQLSRVLAAEPEFDALVVIDSDVVLRGGEVFAVLAELREPGVGAAWLPPVEVAPLSVADRASAAVLDTSLHAFFLLSHLDRQALVGKLIAVRGAALRAIGGLQGLEGYLGEDMELARRLRHAGWESRAATELARSTASRRSTRDVVERYTRWITVIRAQRPWLLPSYPLLMGATPILGLASVIVAAVDGPMLLGAATLVMGTRIAVAIAGRRRSGRPWTAAELARDVLLSDGLILVAFARALCRRHVVWRGRRLRLRYDGRLADVG